MRTVLNFNDHWQFAKPGEPPVQVTLPHTWNAVDGQDGGNDYWRGTAAYTKTFAAPDHAGQRVFLEFNGAANIADVYVNQHHLAHHEGGYSTFRCDITDVLAPENQVRVLVDNAENDRVYPQRADFTFYGGLYRDVKLLLVPQVHFELTESGTPGILVRPQLSQDLGSAQVEVRTWQNGGVVRFTLAGQSVEAASVEGQAVARFTLSPVRLWDGVDDPYLYTVTAELDSGDVISARFGCRQLRFDPREGFFLNGRSYPLRGVSRHQDRAGLGNALTIREHREDLAIIREIGANTVRLAHYQHAQEFYDLCDEAGLLVWAEIPYITQHMPNGRANTLSQMRELLTQCRNHPCIVCWGLSNEITVGGMSPDLVENHRLLNELCHRLDPTRPTTMAHAFMLEQDSPLIPLADLGSYNLYFGWYLGALEQNDKFFDDYHRAFPDRCIGFSEYGADANPRFQSPRPIQGDYSETYQCVYHEHLLELIRQRPYLWATHLWNLFDFAADGRDEGGAHGVNQKGLVTMDRKLRKDAFYLYKAAWSREPFVHLCGRRYVNRAEEVTTVTVYSNHPRVTLLVDGREAGSQEGSTVFRFRVPLAGEHTIQALAGDCRDAMTIRRVDAPDQSYRFGTAASVSNWFDEADFDSSCYSIRDTLGTLNQNPQAAKLVAAMMARARASRGDVAQSASGNANLQKMLSQMSLQALIRQAGENAVPQEAARELNAALQKIKKV